MPVEDVFSITGRGTVVTGRVERGTIHTGETVDIIGNVDIIGIKKKAQSTTVAGDLRGKTASGSTAAPARIDAVYPDSFDDEPAPDLSTVRELINELERQASLLTAVATGGPRIQDVQREYQDRRQRLFDALQRRGLEYPFPWQDLWQWYGHWTGNGLGTYGERRVAIRELVAATISALEQQRSGLRVSDPGSGSLTWADLDARVAGLITELDGAMSRDDLQDVGRRSREIVIDCAKLLADPSLVSAEQVPPKAGDAKAWLDLFLAARASGSHRDELRRFIRAAWDLAQTVTHGNVGRVEAFAAAQATVLVVRTFQALAAEVAAPSASAAS
jgi:hypothetical protein